MNALREQQLAFAAAVREGANVDALPKPRINGEPALVGIYRHAYRARLVAALRDNHEVLALALGDEAFDAIAQAYIDAHPSRFASIRWFGDGLAYAARRACGAAACCTRARSHAWAGAASSRTCHSISTGACARSKGSSRVTSALS